MKILLFAEDNFMETIKELKVKIVISEENECDLFTLGTRPAQPLPDLGLLLLR